MSTMEKVLRDILELRMIGAAKIGGSFSRMARRYGDPTETVDPKEYGFDDRCRIWNYDEVQVWSDAKGTIERIFFESNSEHQQCANQNFVRDMAAIRDKLKGCDVEVFERVLCHGGAKTRRGSAFAEMSVLGEGIELFATFVANAEDGTHRLALLRLNAVAGPSSSVE